MMGKLWSGRKQWHHVINDVRSQHFKDVDIKALDAFYLMNVKLVQELAGSLTEDSEVTVVFKQEVLGFETVIKTLRALHDPCLREDF